MTTRPVEGEFREEPDTRLAAIPVGAGAVSSVVSVDTALDEWHDYQRFTRELLDDNDYQQIGRQRFKKKSAWRKYARFYNITDEVTFEEIQRDDRGRPIFARIRVKATAPNGRTAEADQECHVTERCCPESYGGECRQKGLKWLSGQLKHVCCRPDCLGFEHFSHPGDIPATALTRAKNRAIADLIGAGEVSAEEIRARGDEGEPAARPAARRAAAPQSAAEQHGQEHGAADHGVHDREVLRGALEGTAHHAAAFSSRTRSGRSHCPHATSPTSSPFGIIRGRWPQFSHSTLSTS